jgi:hypothetical protein
MTVNQTQDVQIYSQEPAGQKVGIAFAAGPPLQVSPALEVDLIACSGVFAPINNHLRRDFC